MANIWVVFKRELRSYFATPVAYVFIVIFLFLTGWFTFSRGLGNFIDRGQADLQPFFGFLPWLYLFLIPAITMRVWAEERKTGSIELLMTLPVTLGQAVWGKFLAAWAFTALALAMTFPYWMTVNYLGDPDNGVIFISYLGSLLMAGAYLSIGTCLSAFTRNQVIAFVLSVVVCLLFILSGLPPVTGFLVGWAPQALIDGIASFSFLSRFDAITRGVMDVRDLVFFVSLIATMLFTNAVVLEMKKAN